ncbi:phage tail sheath C-terminal domain-containing protein [Mycobacterium neglectum]|uniref:phage tail sheath C-terminal domain-containing protein n=1 Tax=Mycobacterium neglectum TaxID=242737 RepID=UPI001C3F1D74|nr:phage tail sheath C-terminal domain-containing protein [Mycobacterium neglectum]
MGPDPEWKYANVRRLFAYLERSIETRTQWAVFEPNDERLWASIRTTIQDFLITVWRTGALMGTKQEEAFFVRCDRTTMTSGRHRQRTAGLPCRRGGGEAC